MNPKVDSFIDRASQWRDEYATLRTILLRGALTEELKWGVPCYTLEGRNVVLIHGFKHYCALLFIKGSLLEDPQGVLIAQTENMQAGRQLRFTGMADIAMMAAVINAYIAEAIVVEQAGLKVPMKATAAFDMPDEFQRKLDDTPGLAAAFTALTPGRQRAYLLHFSSAAQAKTRESRVANCMPNIIAGKGLDDR